MKWLCNFMVLLGIILALDHSWGAVVLKQKQKRLLFVPHVKCTYSYEVAVHTARGAHYTASNGFQLHAVVSLFVHTSLLSNRGVLFCNFIA